MVLKIVSGLPLWRTNDLHHRRMCRSAFLATRSSVLEQPPHALGAPIAEGIRRAIAGGKGRSKSFKDEATLNQQRSSLRITLPQQTVRLGERSANDR